MEKKILSFDEAKQNIEMNEEAVVKETDIKLENLIIKIKI